VFAPGVWGPYYSVGVPEFWTNEGGQSLAGKLVSLRVHYLLENMYFAVIVLFSLRHRPFCHFCSKT